MAGALCPIVPLLIVLSTPRVGPLFVPLLVMTLVALLVALLVRGGALAFTVLGVVVGGDRLLDLVFGEPALDGLNELVLRA